MSRTTKIGDLVDLIEMIGRDLEHDRDWLRQRDREIGLRREQTNGSQLASLRFWINQQRKGRDSTPGVPAVKFLITFKVLLVVLGLLSGWVLGQAVFAYTGAQPVNIINALVVLLGLQLLLLLVWILLLLPIPPLSRLKAALSGFNPGSLIFPLLRRAGEKWFDTGVAHLQPLYSSRVNQPVWQWLMALLSQLFTLGFNVGILISLLYLVSISDLAFGWNTTLNVSNDQFYQWIRSISWPWYKLVPSAAPTLELIDISRYYRLDDVLAENGRNIRDLAYQLGRWWPFLLMAVITYGLLPRMVVLVICQWCYRRHLARAIVNQPGSAQILARMSLPLVSTTAGSAQTGTDVFKQTGSLRRWQPNYDFDCVLIEWSNARVSEEQLSALGIRPAKRYSAGGTRTLEEDKSIGDRIVAASTDGIVIAIKSWEAPLLEFVDFCSQLRRITGPDNPMVVLLTTLPGEKVSVVQLQSWEAMLSTLNDSSLYVETVN